MVQWTKGTIQLWVSLRFHISETWAIMLLPLELMIQLLVVFDFPGCLFALFVKEVLGYCWSQSWFPSPRWSHMGDYGCTGIGNVLSVLATSWGMLRVISCTGDESEHWGAIYKLWTFLLISCILHLALPSLKCQRCKCGKGVSCECGIPHWNSSPVLCFWLFYTRIGCKRQLAEWMHCWWRFVASLRLRNMPL